LRLTDPEAFPSPLILVADPEIKNQKSKVKNQK
jgi:hypothetical protein